MTAHISQTVSTSSFVRLRSARARARDPGVGLDHDGSMFYLGSRRVSMGSEEIAGKTVRG